MFSATATSALHGINISDKKLENLTGSFNLSMNMVPCAAPTPCSGDETKKSIASSHAVVKEEHEEDDEEVKITSTNKPSQMPEIHLNMMNMSETAASTCLLDQSTKVGVEQISTLEVEIVHTPKETAEQIRERCKERMDAVKRDVKKEMPLSDQLDMRNPQFIAEFAQDVYTSMLEIEKECMIDNEYLKKVQTEIKDTSRGFLVEWIIDVHRKFRLLPETLYVTVSIIDRYLSKVNIKKSQLHMLGVAALLISTKYEEIYPPELKDLLSISENKFTKEEVLQMEFNILTTL